MEYALVAALGGIFFVLAYRPLRSRLLVFLTKASSGYKYDYRSEWLRFIATLSQSDLEQVPKAAIRAVAQIVDSEDGVVWISGERSERFVPVASWNRELPSSVEFSTGDKLVQFLADTEWVIDLREYAKHPARYENLEIHTEYFAQTNTWLILPMLIGDDLYGLIALGPGRASADLNFEDHDLLKTVGRHVATHIKQAESERRLLESSQLTAYHRLSAFLMHDLKNLIAQQSLVVDNAKKYRDNPRFIDDTFTTIENSVQRMRRIMQQLSTELRSPRRRRIDLPGLLKRVINRYQDRKPQPQLTMNVREAVILADQDRLEGVFEHLVRNAQDATAEDGLVSVTLDVENSTAHVVIDDTGSGMSPEFLADRLFKPFDSTKGTESMGIGAYQAREYVRMIGGTLSVESTPGAGTTFSIALPVAGRAVDRAADPAQ